jgi:hypothetical protein
MSFGRYFCGESSTLRGLPESRVCHRIDRLDSVSCLKDLQSTRFELTGRLSILMASHCNWFLVR